MIIPAGRILMTDTGHGKWGRVVYMTVNPPIVCENCNAVVFEWRSSGGDVVCPECGKTIKDRFYYPCPHCHGDDYHSLRVVNNNNWHYDSTTGEVTEYNDKKGVVLNVCGKELMEDIRHNRVTLLTEREGNEVKRKIIWTSSDDYDSSKPMPQEIRDMFK